MSTIEVPLVPRRDEPFFDGGFRTPSQRYIEYLEQLTDAVQALADKQDELEARIVALEP